MNALVLLLVLTTSTLVLRSGDRIAVDGPVREENGVVTFRSGGLLYSLPADEIDRDATLQAEPESGSAEAAEPTKRLRVSPEERERLLAELAKNHSGTPAPAEQLPENAAEPSTTIDVAEASRDEWSWRREARMYEDAVTRAREELELLESRVDELRSQIHSFMSLGYKPHQFTYQTTQLERTLATLPRARLELARAQRELERFREDARKLGVLPGWIR